MFTGEAYYEFVFLAIFFWKRLIMFYCNIPKLDIPLLAYLTLMAYFELISS